MRDPIPGCGVRILVLLSVYAVAPTCEAAPPGDPVGRWKLSCVCPDGRSRDCVIVISRDGPALTATYRAGGVTRKAKAVAFDRGLLRVQVEGEYAGSRYGLTYTGRPEGDRLCGDVRWSYLWASGTFDFKGERIEEEGVAAR